MQYLLLIYGNETAWLNRTKEASNQVLAAYMAYTEAMKTAGVLVGSNRLRPTTEATTVRAPGGKRSSSTVPTPRPRNSSAAITSSRCRISTRRCRGRRAARAPAGASRCARSGRCSRCRRTPGARDAPRRWRAGATASSSPFSRRARATSRGPRTRCPRPSRRRSPIGRASGIPRTPEAWLLTVARRKLIDAARRRRSGEAAGRTAARCSRRSCEAAADGDATIPDERLRADVRLRASGDRRRHPRAADAADGARLRRRGDRLGVPRLARRRWASGWCARRARSGRPAFRSACRSATSSRERLDAVLEAIYAAFAEGWSDPAGTEARRRDLAEEGDLARPARRVAAAARSPRRWACSR